MEYFLLKLKRSNIIFPKPLLHMIANMAGLTYLLGWDLVKHKNVFLVFEEACRFGNLKLVIKLHNNIRKKHNGWGFKTACEYGHLELAKYFDKYGGFTIEGLERAFTNEHIEILDYFSKENGYWVPETEYFIRSCNKGSLKLVKYFMNEGVSFNIYRGFLIACEKEYFDLIAFFVSIVQDPSGGFKYAYQKKKKAVAEYIISLVDDKFKLYHFLYKANNKYYLQMIMDKINDNDFVILEIKRKGDKKLAQKLHDAEIL